MIPDDTADTTFDQTERPEMSLTGALIALDINPRLFREAIDAEREFAEYLLGAAIQDLYIAGSLHTGQEVVNIARKYWPLLAEGRINNIDES